MKAALQILFIFVLLHTSCSDKKSDEEPRSMNQPDRPISLLKELVISKGDIGAYQELETAYLDYGHGDFYEIAKVMADKHDFPQAYYDVYDQILKPTQRITTTISLDSCTADEKNEAIFYLRKALEKGFEPARAELETLKAEGHIK
jgi:hypothetical protein